MSPEEFKQLPACLGSLRDDTKKYPAGTRRVEKSSNSSCSSWDGG